jgi:hypothetical protein
MHACYKGLMLPGLKPMECDLQKKMPTRHNWTGTTSSHARHLRSVGCVVNPPTPEDALQLRKWPTEGMHERPVWPDPRYEIPKPPASELEVYVHNSLHAVLAFVAQVGRIISGMLELIFYFTWDIYVCSVTCSSLAAGTVQSVITLEFSRLLRPSQIVSSFCLPLSQRASQVSK